MRKKRFKYLKGIMHESGGAKDARHQPMLPEPFISQDSTLQAVAAGDSKSVTIRGKLEWKT
jgi:hypothetical protein